MTKLATKLPKFIWNIYLFCYQAENEIQILRACV